MVEAVAKSPEVHIPVFVKIRLLGSDDDVNMPATLNLVTQLATAGASLIAVHARYRVNLVGRKGPGARDGAAMLDQVAEIKRHLLSVGFDIPIIANGNVITWSDVMDNLHLTRADGIMSAEGLLVSTTG